MQNVIDLDNKLEGLSKKEHFEIQTYHNLKIDGSKTFEPKWIPIKIWGK